MEAWVLKASSKNSMLLLDLGPQQLILRNDLFLHDSLGTF